jgi:Arc/MetJ family transcription regulator
MVVEDDFVRAVMDRYGVQAKTEAVDLASAADA